MIHGVVFSTGQQPQLESQEVGGTVVVYLWKKKATIVVCCSTEAGRILEVSHRQVTLKMPFKRKRQKQQIRQHEAPMHPETHWMGTKYNPGCLLFVWGVL